MDVEESIRVTLVGAASVGKSALAVRLLTGRFLQHYDPTLEDEYRTCLMVDGDEKDIIVVDTAGQDNQRLHYYSHSSNVLLVAFSLADFPSFQHAKQIISLASNERTPSILVGTKADLKRERKVSNDEALAAANVLGCPYLETSAPTGVNVEQAFQLAVGLVLADLHKTQLTQSLELEKKQQKSKPIKGILKRWKSIRRRKVHSTIDTPSTTPSVCYFSSL